MCLSWWALCDSAFALSSVNLPFHFKNISCAGRCCNLNTKFSLLLGRFSFQWIIYLFQMVAGKGMSTISLDYFLNSHLLHDHCLNWFCFSSRFASTMTPQYQICKFNAFKRNEVVTLWHTYIRHVNFWSHSAQMGKMFPCLVWIHIWSGFKAGTNGPAVGRAWTQLANNFVTWCRLCLSVFHADALKWSLIPGKSCSRPMHHFSRRTSFTFLVPSKRLERNFMFPVETMQIKRSLECNHAPEIVHWKWVQGSWSISCTSFCPPCTSNLDAHLTGFAFEQRPTPRWWFGNFCGMCRESTNLQAVPEPAGDWLWQWQWSSWGPGRLRSRDSLSFSLCPSPEKWPCITHLFFISLVIQWDL